LYSAVKSADTDVLSVRHLRLFVWTDIVTTISYEWLEQSWWNLQGIFTNHLYSAVKSADTDVLSVRHLRLFVWTDIVTTISHEWLEQSWWNLQGIFTN